MTTFTAILKGISLVISGILFPMFLAVAWEFYKEDDKVELVFSLLVASIIMGYILLLFQAR